MDTLALDPATWDLTLDAYGNLATFGDATPGVVTGPGMRLAQDVATRVRTWKGEVYYDITLGIDYPAYFGHVPNLPLLQTLFGRSARGVNGCNTAIANFAFTGGKSRALTGSITGSDAAGNGYQVTL